MISAGWWRFFGRVALACAIGACGRDPLLPPGAAGTGGAGGMSGAAADARMDSVGLPPAMADAAIPSGCVPPACVALLVLGCAPAGQCRQQSAGFGATNQCYANGVKISTRLVGLMSVARLTRGGTPCFTLEVGLAAGRGPGGAAAALTFKDPGDRVLATGRVEQGGDTIITCTGGTPVRVPASCDTFAAALGAAVGGNCADGPCP